MNWYLFSIQLYLMGAYIVLLTLSTANNTDTLRNFATSGIKTKAGLHLRIVLIITMIGLFWPIVLLIWFVSWLRDLR